MEKWVFLILVVTRNFGMTNVSSEHVQEWKDEIARHGLYGKEDIGRIQELMRNKHREEMRKPSKTTRCALLHDATRIAETSTWKSTRAHLLGN